MAPAQSKPKPRPDDSKTLTLADVLNTSKSIQDDSKTLTQTQDYTQPN